jgi:glycosyltransferase involved in cell wall biosynthesis
MPDFLIFAGIVPKLTGARLILYLFESMPEMWAQRRQVPMTHWSIKLLCWHEKISCSFADAIICCHDLAKDALVKRGIPENKITSILNVPDDNVFQKNNDDESNDNHSFYLIQHGTMTENYGIQTVLQALKLLNPTLPVHFDVVGSGEYKPVLEKMVLDLDLTDRVTFHGFVSREKLMELLHRANVGVVPMLFEYQSPNKMFELVALGKPVIASDRLTFQQHFDSSEVLYFKTGDAADLAKAIEKAYQNRDHLMERAMLALLRYENYQWRTMGSRYLAVYEKLIHKGVKKDL